MAAGSNPFALMMPQNIFSQRMQPQNPIAAPIQSPVVGPQQPFQPTPMPQPVGPAPYRPMPPSAPIANPIQAPVDPRMAQTPQQPQMQNVLAQRALAGLQRY
jgi:hypothetical protein